MYKVVTIGTKAIPMLSNGATPYRFKQVFNMDLLKFFSDADKGKSDEGELATVVEQLAYVMALQAEKHDMNKANIEGFYDWLEQFEPSDIIVSAEDIIGVYACNLKQTSSAKKKRN